MYTKDDLKALQDKHGDTPPTPAGIQPLPFKAYDITLAVSRAKVTASIQEVEVDSIKDNRLGFYSERFGYCYCSPSDLFKTLDDAERQVIRDILDDYL